MLPWEFSDFAETNTCVPGLNNLAILSTVWDSKWDREIYSKAKGSSEAMCQFVSYQAL